MIMWGPKRHSYRDPAHRFNKSCKKGNTFNKNVPKRQITNPYRDPADRFHKDFSNFHHKKPKGNIFLFLTSLLSRTIIRTNIFHFSNNLKRKKKKKEKRKKKKSLPRIFLLFRLWRSELLVGQCWLESVPVFGVEC
jgi:hypothetical protein